MGPVARNPGSRPMDQIPLGLLILNFVLLLVLVQQVREARRTREADHERRSKQATIEYYSGLRDAQEEIRALVDTQLGTDTLSEAEVVALLDSQDGSTARALRLYLSRLEWLAADANSRVYDRAVLRRLAGTRIVWDFHRFRNYTLLQRRRLDHPTLHTELEALVEYWANENRVELPGNIKKS